MYRIAAFVLAVFLLQQNVAADPAESLIPESLSYGLQGNVSQFMEFERDQRSLLVLKRSVVFGLNGKPTAERTYGPDGDLAGEKRFVYSKDGLLSEIRGADSSGGITWRYSYSYDVNGRMTSESAFDSSGGLEGRVTYSYDGSDRLSRKTQHDRGGTPSLQDIFQYDENSRLVARLTLYSDGKLLKRVMYFYDVHGRETMEERYDANGLYEREEYAYGTDGYLATIKTFTSSGALRKRIKRTCGTDGRIIEERVFAADGTIRSHTEYQYDAAGNWVSRHETGKSFVFREYIYLK